MHLITHNKTGTYIQSEINYLEMGDVQLSVFKLVAQQMDGASLEE
jgi:hypothetical protein